MSELSNTSRNSYRSSV